MGADPGDADHAASTHTTTFEASARAFPLSRRVTRPSTLPDGTGEARAAAANRKINPHERADFIGWNHNPEARDGPTRLDPRAPPAYPSPMNTEPVLIFGKDT